MPKNTIQGCQRLESHGKMNEMVSDFVQRFHNLEGLSFDERRRDFFRLLQENSVIDYGNLDSIVNRLEPKTHLESILFIDLLIYYRCFNELYVEFMKGNEIAVSKLAKEMWFFQKAFQDVDANFVHEVLPTVSYSIRMKILKKLKDFLTEDQCNVLFDALFQRYGVFMATNILLGCSVEKIEDTLRNHPIQLGINQLKLLYKRKPDLIYVYLEERVRLIGSTDWLNSNPIFKFIALENPEMFCNLQEKYEISYCKIGKRTTKKLVRNQKEKIIAKPKLYVGNLHKRRLVRTLKEDFQELYFNLYPRQMNSIYNYSAGHLELIEYYPKQYQFQLFKSTFDRIFEEKLETRSNLIENRVLEMISSSDEDRDKWVNIRRQHEDTDDYLQYLRADQCIAAIEAKFNTANRFESRVTNIRIMTQSCLLNKDWKSLLRVLQFLCTRFKNDESQLFIQFLGLIDQNKNGVLDNLDDNHWSLVRQVLCRREIKVSGYYDPSRILYKYFQFLAKTRSDFEEVFLDFTQDSSWNRGLYIYILNYLPKTNVKLCLLFLIKNAATLCKDQLQEANIKLIVECFKHNKRCKNDTIDVWAYPTLIESLETALSNPESEIDKNILAAAVKNLICTFDESDRVDRLAKIYWNNFDKCANLSLVNWFLKYAPQKISCTEKFFDTLIKFNFLDWWDHSGEVKKVWYKIKNYSHLFFDQKLIEYCMSKLRDDAFSDKINLAQPLSMLMPQVEFLTLVDSYKPVKTNVNLQDSLENAQYQIQRYFLKSLINTKQPEQACSIILKFFNEDYVKSCLSSLYSCLYRIPERNLQSILTEICSKQGVSAKKHGYYFTCVALDQNALTSALQSCRLSQSIAMTYQYFVKNPSEASWKLLTVKLPKLDKNDDFTNQVLINTPAPKAYKSQYFVLAYQEFKKQNNKFTHVLVNKLTNDTIGELNQEFLLSIQDDFLSMKKSECIFASYLVYSHDANKYQIIANVLRRFREKHWSLRAREPRVNLAKFVDTVFEYYMNSEKTSEDFTTLLLECFQRVFSDYEVFEEFLLLSLMKFKSYTLSNFCQAIARLNDQLVAGCGEIVIPLLTKVLNKKLPKFYATEELMYSFYLLLIRDQRSINNLLLVTQLLPKTEPELVASARLYKDIIQILESVEDDKVKVQLYALP